LPTYNSTQPHALDYFIGEGQRHQRAGKHAQKQPAGGGQCGAMTSANRIALSEHYLCAKFVTAVLVKASWDPQKQIREKVYRTKGRGIVSVHTHRRGEAKRLDHRLHYKANLPLAIVAARYNNHARGAHLLAAGTRPSKKPKSIPSIGPGAWRSCTKAMVR
jgi:hypothetical protein